MHKRDRRFLRLVCVAMGALMIALSVTAVPGEARAAVGPPNRLGPVQLQNVMNGLAIDAEGEHMAEGQKILQYTYGARRGQQWWFEAASGSSYRLKSNVNGAYCIGLNGTLAVLKKCEAEETTWEFDEVAADQYLVKAPGSERYLIAPTELGGSSNRGGQLTLGTREEAHKGRGRWYLTDLRLEAFMPPQDPRLDQVTFLTTHNAFNNPKDGFPLAVNQSNSMAQQLSDGVRGLMLDIHERDGAVLMCHGTCEIGSKPLKDGLRDVVAFLETNKNAVVTIFMEDYAKDREKLAQQFVDVPGLLDLVFNPAAQEVMSKGWPRLSEMRAKNKRLLIFSDHGDLTRAGVVGSRPWTVENYWSLGHDGRNWDCYSRWDGTPLTHREPSFSPLFVMNQFRSIPESLNAPFDNGDKLVDRAVNFCGPAARKMPNYVSIDFYELGDNLRAVDTINRYRYVERAETLAPSVPSSALLTSENRRGALPGLPDWSGAGYRGGGPLPGNQQISADAACRVTPEELDRAYGVRPNDSADDSAGLQRAIDDIRADCSGTAGFDRNSLISLPAGRIDISKQISVDASHLVIRGQGSDPAGGTRIVFRPDADTRYDTLTADGSRWDQDTMTAGTAPDQAKGGWVWPGRGLFRVQTREVAPRYADDWKAAPANRKDLYEGSVNQHWASGMKLRGSTADPGYAAKEGGRVVPLDPKASIALFQPGQHVWVGAANSRKFYELQTATATDRYENLHMRQQVFRVASVDTAQRTVTLDKPLEFDLPVDSTSDGSAPIGDSAYPSKVMPLKMVVGVGFENFSFTQDMTGVPAAGGGTHHLNPAQAKNNYGNLAPEYALHGLVFKWAADSWARGVRADMTGSHPIVTEVAKNLQFEGNHLDGAWNKGKGGNGYFRGSRVWDSLYAQNTTRNLRHFTFQWSASNNVVYGNDFDSDLNLHGGWERRNLFENNTVRVPYEHRSGHCTARCGGEGGDTESGTWYPIWWAAGEKAVKWAGASGPQNVFHRNVLAKQLTPGGPYVDYLPYGKPGTGPQPVYQFGSGAADPGTFRHLTRGGKPIADWNGHELADYLTGDAGVNASRTEAGPSLFLKSVP